MQRLLPLLIFDIKETNGFKKLSENPSEQEPAMVLLIRDFSILKKTARTGYYMYFMRRARMIGTQLILLEGMPSTGKTTNSRFIQVQLERNQINAEWIHEVAMPHPVLFLMRLV